MATSMEIVENAFGIEYEAVLRNIRESEFDIENVLMESQLLEAMEPEPEIENVLRDFELLEAMEHAPDHHAVVTTSATSIDSLVKVKTTKDNLKNLAITSCAICTDDFDVDQDVYQLPCSHWFHRDCILPWLGRKNTCPLCRYVLPKEERTNEVDSLSRVMWEDVIN